MFRFTGIGSESCGSEIGSPAGSPYDDTGGTPGVTFYDRVKVRAGASNCSAFDAYGADRYSHTAQDTPANLDPKKLEALGRTVALVLTALRRESIDSQRSLQGPPSLSPSDTRAGGKDSNPEASSAPTSCRHPLSHTARSAAGR